MLHHLQHAVQSILAEHPEARVQIEFQEIPADLKKLFDTMYPPGGSVGYGVLTDVPAE